MPLYEYRCERCSNEFEVLVRRSDTAICCPACASTEASKKVSRSSFHLKGTGWFASEYAAASAAPSGGGLGEGGSGASKASEGGCGCASETN